MKKLLLFILILFSLSGYSQTCENSLLWEISGNGLEKPSYIFGTIHMISTKDYFFEDIWKEKFNNCETLVLETELSMGFFKQLGMMKKIMLPDDATLQDYMKPEDYKLYESFMLDSLLCSSAEFNMYSKMKPFFTYSMILTKLIGSDIQIYEMNLSDMADKNKIDVIGLETIDFQMSLVDSIPIESQIEMFIFDEKTTKQSMIKEFDDMVVLYKNQDITSLFSTSTSDPEMADFEEDLLKTRNQKWVPDIITIIEHQPAFIAVGAGHLAGNYGVLNLLKKEGYTLKAIKN